jgi:hypothetical protein
MSVDNVIYESTPQLQNKNTSDVVAKIKETSF